MLENQNQNGRRLLQGQGNNLQSLKKMKQIIIVKSVGKEFKENKG